MTAPRRGVGGYGYRWGSYDRVLTFFVRMAYFVGRRLSKEWMIVPATLPLFPASREKATSLRIEDHKVVATANKDSLKKHGRQ